MAAASPEATEIRRRGRQRLIGAVAIVLLAVVFVPMLLDSDPRPARTGPALTIPSKDQAPPLPAPAPAKPVAATQAASQPAVAQTPAPAAASAPVAPAKAGAQSSPETAKADAAKSDPGLRRGDNVPKLEGFAVQVGAFRDEAKLAQAREKLTAEQVPHYTERLDTSSGPLTRLRAGPFPTREAADAAATRLKSAQLPSRVVSLP